MPNGADNQSVRPLRGDGVEQREHRTPPFVAVIALLAVGGLIGWVGASIGGRELSTPLDPPSTQSPDERNPISLSAEASPSVAWVKAEAPEIPSGMEWGGFSGIAEMDDHLYTLVTFVDPSTGEEVGELWQSAEGRVWQASTIDIGEPVTVDDLVAIDDRLLLTGHVGHTAAMWQSVPGRAIDGASWARVPLDIPERFDRWFIGAVANDRGGSMTMIIGNLLIWSEVVEPYLPDGVDLTDPRYSYHGDEFLYVTDSGDDVRLFAEPPQVVVTGDSVWVRIITLAGEEILQTFPLPEATYPTGGEPTLADIPLLMAWISNDGTDFLPVTGTNALPRGFFMPEPWGDGFIGAVHNMEKAFAGGEDVTLWGSRSGRAWEPAGLQPPRECSPFMFAVSGNRMHLTTSDGTQCVRDIDSPWEVLAEPISATYVIGGGAGFVGYPNSFEYDTALFSRDGTTWIEILLPTPEPYPAIEILDDRLVAFSVTHPPPESPSVLEIWVGMIS
ncbi:MAG: hypothetical protein U9N84_07810 [Actinomycetota bacterium]|nr:hypothetical protein [Actinomycetota bacterium]